MRRSIKLPDKRTDQLDSSPSLLSFCLSTSIFSQHTMGVPSDFDSLEQRRLALEDNILQLQKSLYHWRTWEAEYDGLREEIRELPEDASTNDFLAVGRDFGGSLVNEEELEKIIGLQGITRSRGQVVDLLGRRIDYVQQNVATMEKKLRTAEDELCRLDTREQHASDSGSSGFPVREIIEELDEEGNVVSSSVNTPGDQASELLETLKKAGVENIPEDATTNGAPTVSKAIAVEERDIKDAGETPPQPPEQTNSHPPAPTMPDRNGATERSDIDLSHPVSLVTPEDRKEPPITDVDESPEEAKLRREMLQYGIDEVGAIVAELEMDEDGSEFSIDEDDYELGTDDEEEDEFGRSHTALSEEYHQQMRELEAKHNARGMWNVGKDAQSVPEEVRQEIELRSSTTDAQPKEEVDNSSKGKKPKKRVAFANDLDIAPATETTEGPVAERKALPPQPDVPVLSESIIERTDRAQVTTSAAVDSPKRVSKFKSARSTVASDDSAGQSSAQSTSKPSKFAESRPVRKQANAIPSTTPPQLFPATPREAKPFSMPIADAPQPSVPRPPEGKTLADNLVEREVKPGAAAPEPNELDEEIHQREIASEFYRARNRMIQQQGGFTGEQEVEPLHTEDQPRISKFRAARMR